MPGGLFSEAYSAMEHVESTMQNKPELQPAPKTSASPKMDATAGAGDEKGKKKRGFGMGKLMGLVHIGAGSAAAAPEAARPGQLALAAEREQPHKPGVRVPSAPTRMNTQQLALGGDSGQEAVVHGKTRKLNRNTTLGRISRGTWKVEDDQPSSIPTPPKMSKKKDGKGSAAGSKVTFGSRWSKASPRVSEGSEGGEGSGSWSAGDLTPHERGSSAEELEESDHLTALYHDPEHGPGGKRHSLLKASVLKADARQRPLEGHHPRHPYEALVFKGGGAKGSIYPGAIKALEDLGERTLSNPPALSPTRQPSSRAPPAPPNPPN